MKSGFAALAALLLSACVSHQGRPPVPPPNPLQAGDFSVNRDLIYTPAGWPQRLGADFYTPAGAGPFPAVLVVHGGGWEGRTRADMDGISAALASRGYAVLNVSYRFAPQWHFPAQLQDLQQALLWLRANAGTLNIRPDRIAGWGYSAGAHLAALAGVTGPGDAQFVEGARVQAVVAGGTPADLRYYPDGKLTNGLMGVALGEQPELWKAASPLALISQDDPPVFLYHGSFDFTVGDYNAQKLFAALQAAGVPAELYLIRGLEHFSTFYLDGPVEQGIEFLDRYLR